MTITHCTINTKPLTQSTCCSTKSENAAFQKTIDSVCRIAIGIFAAIYAPVTFVVSLQIGLLAGISYAAYRLYQNKPMLPDGENKPVCAQGYMDFLSGMKFPSPAGTIATAVFIAAHTRHDPEFYVPFCGLFIGFFLGRQAAVYGSCLSAKLFEVKQPSCPCS